MAFQNKILEVMDLLPGSQSMPRYYSIKRYSTHTSWCFCFSSLTSIHFCLAHRENNTPGRKSSKSVFVFKLNHNFIIIIL